LLFIWIFRQLILPDIFLRTIVADAKVLIKNGIDRHVIAKKIFALFLLEKVQGTGNAAKVLSEENRAEIKQELKIDPFDEKQCNSFPIKIVRLRTGGHHEDVLHPHRCCTSNSYYLKGDNVGGDCECLILNTSLMNPSELPEWDMKKINQKISARLNAPKPAEWDDHPAVIYFSNMAPYLIRSACFFEGENVRYRISPEKLISVLRNILS